MSFRVALDQALARFPENGSFDLLPGESINDVVRREKVPKSRGVYAIFGGPNGEQHLLYVGKAGTMNGDGSWKIQGLRKRLTMKQDKVYRHLFFADLIKSDSPTGLRFTWLVTHNETVKVLPALVELQLLQAFYEEHACLPQRNRCI